MLTLSLLALRGGRRHIDGGCDSTVSVQFSGDEEWFIWPSALHVDQKMFAEGSVYRAFIRACEALVFYPGMHHGTRVLGGNISLAAAFFFSHPPPFSALLAKADGARKQGCKVLTLLLLLLLLLFVSLLLVLLTSLRTGVPGAARAGREG